MENNAKDLLNNEVNKYVSDEPAVVLYSAYTREELERNSLLHDEKKIAREEGLKEGREEGIKDTINKLYNNNVSKEVIMDSLNLTEEEFNKYINKEVI